MSTSPKRSAGRGLDYARPTRTAGAAGSIPRYLSPLRYPGGKQRLGRFFATLIAENGLTGVPYVEPFAGGAGVALYLLEAGVVSRALINDADRSLFAFWWSAVNRRRELRERLRRAAISVCEWERQKEVQRQKRTAPLLDLGFSTLFLNRVNRSGILRAGIIGGRRQLGRWRMDARFNREGVIDRLDRIAALAHRISVSGIDAREILASSGSRRTTRCFLYCDPPYYAKGQDLYLNRFTPEDHTELAGQILQNRWSQWAITYDDVPEIRRLYRSASMVPFSLAYSADSRRIGRETLITSGKLVVSSAARAALSPVSRKARRRMGSGVDHCKC